MALAPPVPKKFRGEAPQQGDPLPIPIASYTGFPSSASSWNYYKGVYKDGAVIVTDLNQIASLWHNGYFGQLKNTDLQNDEYVGDEYYKYAKRWKLLETDGIRDSSFFKKTVEFAVIDGEGETDGGSSKTKEEELDSFEVKREQDINKRDSVESVEENRHKTEPPFAFGRDAERGEHVKREEACETGEHVKRGKASERGDKASKENCKTLLTLESDHLPSVFFDDDAPSGHLELLPEEAMYLSYALGCLVVEKGWVAGARPQHFKGKQKLGGKEFTIDQLWRKLVNDEQKFVARYAVYHHYRAKGWVVRSGLKFGADYVLYPVGPPFYHAQFTVMIQCVWSDTNSRDESLSSRELSWTNFSATERLNTHVKKVPLITYVVRPRSITSEGLYKISCLKSLVVREVVLSRWDPTAAVEPDKGEIILD